MRPTRALLLIAALIVMLGVSGGLALATTSRRTAKTVGRADYLQQARAICREYSRRLDRIPPIQDPTLLGEVIESTNAAIPILREQADRIRTLEPPADLRATIDRFFVLTDRSIATLEDVRTAARRTDSNNVGVGLIRFGRESTAAKRVGRRIGYRC